MTNTLSHALEQRWQEILRRAALALNGRSVGVWEADAHGRPQLLVASPAEDVSPRAAAELEATLREVGELPAAGPSRRWVASRLEPERWCIAPVRSEPPQPPPAGVERRGPERLLLELAGVCIGLIERRLAEQPLPFKAVAELAEEKLVHQALHDALTDLPNRAYFVERVSQAQARVRRDPDYRFAVLFIDFDDFKAVNDNLGHAAGDRLLMEIAGRLRTCVRPGDVVARLGGDEFTLLLEEISGLPDAEHAARRIQAALVAPIAIEGREIVATASIGVALSEPDYGQVQDLLRDADLAMYHAKEQGRARYQVFDVAMRDSAQARFGMEADLRTALEHGDLHLVFQPIVELQTGGVHGFEALLRWHRPKRGVILPPEFVPLAEQTGLIIPIGRWVLQEACRQARGWHDAFPAAGPVRISVNLSGKQLAHPGLADDVRAALQDAGLSPSRLILEIGENVLMESAESSTDVLHQLRELKVELHIDDFGTGHSSLSSLPRFPIHGIKIDRAFVHRMGSRRTDLEIVRSIVELAGNLSLGVIAEGVETVTQRARLIAFGCELGQGHLFAKPLEAQAAGALLAGPEEPGRRIA